MPAGTWNLGKIRRTVDRIGLATAPTIEFNDTSPFSIDHFNITEWPSRLTSGKNIIKFNAINRTLVDNSRFKWGDACSSDKIPLKLEDFLPLLKPSIDLF